MRDEDLYHFGIKGMKWGVWNDETKARYSGEKKNRKKKKDESGIKIRKKHPFLKGLGIAAAVAGAGYSAKNFTNHNGPTGTSVKIPTRGDKIRGKVLGTTDKITADALLRQTKDGKDKPKQSKAEKMTKDFGRIPSETENIINVLDRSERNKIRRMINEQTAKEVKNLSDQELRNKINRMSLERQYASLKYGDIETGYESASEVLQTVGAIVGITSAGVAIASTMYSLLHP